MNVRTDFGIALSLSIIILGSGCTSDATGAATCVINATQKCVGNNLCSGVQTCIDGTRLSPCRCAHEMDGGGAFDDAAAVRSDARSGDGAMSQDDGAAGRDGAASNDGGGGGGGSQAPRIITLSANVTRLFVGQQLKITAIVSDPQGINDLIGGQLEHPGGGTYGNFATAAQEGAYGMTLDWQAINQVAPIDAPVAGIGRSFRARFFDVAGHEATRDIVITLLCGGAQSACQGVCIDLQRSGASCGKCGYNCGTVGNSLNLPSGTTRACVQGSCEFEGYASTTDDGDTCAAVCKRQGFDSCITVHKIRSSNCDVEPTSQNFPCSQRATTYQNDHSVGFTRCDVTYRDCRCGTTRTAP